MIVRAFIRCAPGTCVCVRRISRERWHQRAPTRSRTFTFDKEREMQKRRMATVIGGVFCVGALAACSDLTNPFGRSPVATYSLQTVNGYRLPYTFNDGISTISIQGDAYALHEDRSYGEITNETVSDGYRSTNVAQTEYGTWSGNNGDITFNPTSSTRSSYASYRGYVDNNGTLTIALNGTQSVYYAQ